MNVIETILDFCTGDWGEDRLYTGQDLCCVIDGATSIRRQAFDGYHSSAEWMADRLIRYVEDRGAEGIAHPQVCRAFVDDTAGKVRTDIAADTDLPCLTTAAVRREGDLLKCWVVGDCSIYLLLADGSVRRVTDQRIATFYRRTLAAKENARLRGEDVEAAVRHQRTQNKAFLNQPGGYWTVAYTGDFENYFVEETLEATQVRAALLCTDGFDRLFDFGLAEPRALLTKELSLGQALEQLRTQEIAMENADRLNVKVHDDVAAILLEM